METTFVNKKIVTDKVVRGFSPLSPPPQVEAPDYFLPNAVFKTGNFTGFPPAIRVTLPSMIDQVREHLRLLSIFHYVVGGIGYLVSLIPTIHLAFGIFFLAAPEEFFEPPKPPKITVSSIGETPSVEVEKQASEVHEMTPNEVFPARLFGLLFTIIPAIIILCGFIVSTLIVIAGKRMASYRSHTFCLVVAGIECLFMPFGTVLGVFSILTLIKPEARQLFGLSPVGGTAA
jgi:hypothetical protein